MKLLALKQTLGITWGNPFILCMRKLRPKEDKQLVWSSLAWNQVSNSFSVV